MSTEKDERKKSHGKVYPKGYVDQLEQQQSQLVSALQETYRRLTAVQAWTGPALPEANGHPLTHDVLRALDLLESKSDGSGKTEVFEDDCQKLQSRLLADGAGYIQRCGSPSSDSNHSQRAHLQSTNHGPPPLSRPDFRDSFNFSSADSSPAAQSPVPRHRQKYAAAQRPQLPTSPLSSDPQFYQMDWTMSEANNVQVLMQSRFAMQTPNVQQSLSQLEDMIANGQFEPSAAGYDPSFGSLPMTSYPQHFSNSFGSSMPDFNPLDPMDLEFSKFIQVTT
ncbi:hypothetical protein B0A54_17066 [Friedmanniomyces endolithicus]|uniref:Uncharacterized protein n=1 Tax=Friedmanniomyces endolithicus TaxID=329885 RepID=A0A4U0TXP8_9PEZI|nr:Fluconazole resistance protein 1 [Friedmanniomyces endolithicus]TKA27124.1 hypothetical protein B0A54_17066 [Friedmanniomyces endolithicus]